MRFNDFLESKLLVEMRVCFAIYKLVQGENLLMCFELFVIGKPLSHLFFVSLLKLSTFSILKMIKWSKCVDVELVMTKMNYCCGMPSMHGVMNKTHIHIAKPIKTPFLKNIIIFKQVVTQ